MIIHVNIPQNDYDVVFEKGALKKVSEYFKLDRKVLIVTDDGVPSSYSKEIASKCSEPFIVTLRQGEASKNLDNYALLLKELCDNHFSRKDCVIAIGGGVIGDLAGFVAASYMRGIDFYNIPTTSLSQIDSSIGGKTAIDFNGLKNIVGAFYQPKKVLIDIDVLKTLPQRQLNNGLVEALKMATTSNTSLFELFENEDIYQNIEKIIYEAILIKKDVVEKDEKELGLRKVLNFGHTIGHGIEVNSDLLHGEAVTIGMLPMCDKDVKERLTKVLNKLDIETKVVTNIDKVVEAISHDKKGEQGFINCVYVDKIGNFKFIKSDMKEIKEKCEEIIHEK